MHESIVDSRIPDCPWFPYMGQNTFIVIDTNK